MHHHHITLVLNMRCFAAVIFVLLFVQNSRGINECDDEQDSVLQSYRKLLTEEENDASDKDEDPETRMNLYATNSQRMHSKISYYPSQEFQYQTIPSQEIMFQGEQPMFSFHSGLITDSRIINLFSTIKLKTNVSVQDLLQRVFKIFVQWPEIKSKLERTHTISFRGILQVLLEIMYPEWDATKINMIFQGINDEDILRQLFIAIFPNWPKGEVKKIFSPTNNIPLILKTMLKYVMPDLLPSDINYIFENTNSILLVLRRLFYILFPNYPSSELDYTFDANNSILDVFERLLQLFFSQHSNGPPMHLELPNMQWDNIYDVLFPGISIPTYTLQNSAPDSTLTFLLNQLNNTRTMPNYSYKRDDALLIILSEWLKINPNLIYHLSSPGHDDFYHFKNKLFPNTNDEISFPWEFRDDTFLRELFDMWQHYILPQFPSSQNINSPDVISFLVPFIKQRVDPSASVAWPTTILPSKPWKQQVLPGWQHTTALWPSQQTQPTPSTVPKVPATSLDFIPSRITNNYINGLFTLPQPMRDNLVLLNDLPKKEKSFPIILDLLADGSKPDVKNRVPDAKLFELILKLITKDWPDSEIKKVVGNDPSIKKILKNLCTTMFLDWPKLNSDTKVNDMNSPKQILELFIKKALPQLPKQQIDNIFNGPDDIDTILDRLFILLFPNWPDYNTFFTYFDLALFEKAIKEIINWPKNKSVINSQGKVSVPRLLESLLMTLFPTWPLLEISMIVSTQVPLPLIIEKLLQNKGTSNVELPSIHPSSKVKLPFDLFKAVFPGWPNYTSYVPDTNVHMQTTEIIRLLWSKIEAFIQKIPCLQTSECKWIVDLIMTLIDVK